MLKATFILALVASASAYDAFGDNAYPAGAGGGRHHAQLRDPAAADLGIWEGNDFGLGLRYVSDCAPRCNLDAIADSPKPTPTRRRAPKATGHSPHPPATAPPTAAALHPSSGDDDDDPRWGRARACAGSLLALLTGNVSTIARARVSAVAVCRCGETRGCCAAASRPPLSAYARHTHHKQQLTYLSRPRWRSACPPPARHQGDNARASPAGCRAGACVSTRQ